MLRLKKWPLIWREKYFFGGEVHLGSPRCVGSRVSTRSIWANCAGVESEAHIRYIQRIWPEISAAAIRQALRFERSRGRNAGREKY
jgi:uncharacterized protein (DUF433 family)